MREAADYIVGAVLHNWCRGSRGRRRMRQWRTPLWEKQVLRIREVDSKLRVDGTTVKTGVVEERS